MKMKEKGRILSILSYLVICVMVITMLMPLTCFAEKNETKIVRVAYVIAPGYQEGAEGEYKSGYGYEYLQKIASINGWKYEYVYGSFSELLEKLQNGEVDLMGNLSYTEERAKTISYGDYEQGKESYYLYANQNHNMIDPFDYRTINGKKIGVSAGSNQEKVWMEWCKNKNIDCEIIEYKNLDDRQAALNNGDIDATIGGEVQKSDVTVDWKVLFRYGSSPFYFGVNRKEPALLKELNEAQKEILDENPFYNEEVHNRYMKSVSLATTNLDDQEIEWLKSNKQIKVGYLKGFPPLCYKNEEGKFCGVAADLFSAIETEYADTGVQFSEVEYNDYATMRKALLDGKISVAWPVYYDYWNAEQSGIKLTDCLVTTSMMLVYDEEYTEDTVSKIGVINTGSLPKIYAQIHYPNSEITEYDTYEDAIQAILNNEVNSVLYVSTTYNVDIKRNEKLSRLQVVTLPENFGICLAVSENATELTTILNKGIVVFGESGVNHSLVTNSYIEQEVTIKSFLKQHPYFGILFVLIVAGIVILIIYYTLSVRIKTSRAEKEVFERISNSDPLTKLYNRKAVFHKCSELLKEHPDDQFVMVHVDMKHFRLYNTFFGDEAGDQLLCDIADLLRMMAKDYEYWAYGRMEADVFCVFFPYDKEKYQKHMTMCLKYLKEYRSDFLIEPTLGMYFVTDKEMPLEAMFTRASLAANEVRSNTPYATVIYDDKLEKELNEKQQIINEMQMAIDDEQFKVYLQPKYSLRTNKMVGAEALVRWMHPTKGMVSPGQFIPVFERNGFITTLDRYMWEHVCQLLSKWKKEEKNITPVSVNVSRLSMFGPTTVDFLKELVIKYDIDPKYLELELTESAYIDDPEEMKQQMTALRDAGFTILLDDFGSGYSSLNTLREIPVDILKLDMKFLSLNNEDLRGGLVISSIVRMSKLLKLSVIAEGVELQGQADFLKSIGCEYVQGYLFSRPVPVEDYEKLLINGVEPLEMVNQPVLDHIGRIIAETGSGTYAMGSVIPVPLACIEYVNHQIGFLRVNPDFYTEFSVSEELEPMPEIFKKHISEKSYEDFIQGMEHSVQSGEKVRVPIIWNTDDGSHHMYICSAAYEGNVGTASIIVVTFTNVTGITKRKDDENQRNTSSEKEGRLLGCVKKLVAADNIYEATNSILQEVMTYYNADRAYIFEFEWEKYICTNTYEVCALNVEPEIDNLQEVSIDALEVWVKLFNKKALIHIRDLNELIGDENRKDEYDVLAPQGIHSLIAVPVYFEEKLVGFLGVDNPKINMEDTAFIESLAFLCVNESLREKEKENLENISMQDPLTGAYNRKAMEHEQKKLIRKKIPFSVVMIDVDNYKSVNDQYGHQIGDEVLKRLVSTLKELFRADDMVIRYGGDEFVIIMENSGSWAEEVVTEKIDRLNEILSQADGHLPEVSVSVGIASSDDCNPEDVFRNADNALYHVKNSGKKGWHIYKGKID